MKKLASQESIPDLGRPLKREHSAGTMASVATWARGISLSVAMTIGAMTPAHAQSTEKVKVVDASKKPEPWIGKSFTFYASSKDEAVKEASSQFKSKFNIGNDEAGVDLAVEFSEATGKAVATVVKRTSAVIANRDDLVPMMMPEEVLGGPTKFTEAKDQNAKTGSMEEVVAKPATLSEIKLKNLGFLDPISDNLSPKSKPYPKTIAPDQMPPLWLCDDASKDKDKLGMDVASNSLVFELAKRVEGSVRTVHDQNKDRLRLLGVLKNVLDTYQIDSPTFGAGVMPDHQKKLKQLNDLHLKNLEATQKLVALWEPLHKTASEVRASIKQLVLEEMRVGMRAEKCAKPQEEVGDYRLLQLLPKVSRAQVGEYAPYDGLVPKGLAISPYICANLSKGKASETDSDLYQWLDQLESVMTEHAYASMERQRAYIENADRLTGAVGPGKEAERSAFNSVLAVQAENQKILEQWKQLIIKVQALKAEAFKAINAETLLAKKLKRCTRIPEPDSTENGAPSGTDAGVGESK